MYTVRDPDHTLNQPNKISKLRSNNCKIIYKITNQKVHHLETHRKMCCISIYIVGYWTGFVRFVHFAR